MWSTQTYQADNRYNRKMFFIGNVHSFTIRCHSSPLMFAQDCWFRHATLVWFVSDPTGSECVVLVCIGASNTDRHRAKPGQLNGNWCVCVCVVLLERTQISRKEWRASIATVRDSVDCSHADIRFMLHLKPLCACRVVCRILVAHSSLEASMPFACHSAATNS